MVAVEEVDHILLQPSFTEAFGQERIVERREKLSDIKGDDASVALFNPPRSY